MLIFVETSKIAEKSALKALRVTTQAPGTGALEQLSNYLRCFISSLCHPPSLPLFPSPSPSRARSLPLPASLPASDPVSLDQSGHVSWHGFARNLAVIKFACFLNGQRGKADTRSTCVRGAPASKMLLRRGRGCRKQDLLRHVCLGVRAGLSLPLRVHLDNGDVARVDSVVARCDVPR